MAAIFWIWFCRLLFAIIHILYYIINYFKSNSIDLKLRYGDMDTSWVVITGGANGIGAEFAKKFANKGFNVFLWDWNKEDIDKIEQDIRRIDSSIKFKGV